MLLARAHFADAAVTPLTSLCVTRLGHARAAWATEHRADLLTRGNQGVQVDSGVDSQAVEQVNNVFGGDVTARLPIE